MHGSIFKFHNLFKALSEYETSSFPGEWQALSGTNVANQDALTDVEQDAAAQMLQQMTDES
jgi:hypothetical protein